MRVRIDERPCRKQSCRRLSRSRRSCPHVSRLASSSSHPPSFHIPGLFASIHLRELHGTATSSWASPEKAFHVWPGKKVDGYRAGYDRNDGYHGNDNEYG